MTDLLSYVATLDAEDRRSLPPVEKWHPANVGVIDIRIDSDGVWYHEGSPIKRARLAQLFSTILIREGNAHFLVTPVEKLEITVDDVAFTVVLMDVENAGPDQVIRFTTNVGDIVLLDNDHCISIRNASDSNGDAPYIHVRRGLEARLTRACAFELMSIAEQGSGDHMDYLGVMSAGVFFPLLQLAENAGVM